MSFFDSFCAVCCRQRRRVSTQETEEHRLAERGQSLRSCVETMRQNEDDYEIQLKACKRVGTFARLDTLQVVLAREDAVDCLVAAMSRFPDREGLQFNACESLLKLASESDVNCFLIQEKKGIPVILEALDRFTKNPKLTFLIINLICFLSSNEKQGKELFKLDCQTRILDAMTTFSNEHNIIKHCLFALANLLLIVERGEDIGGVNAVINMMSQFPNNTDIKENGCRTLGNFASYDDTCESIHGAGGTQVVLMAMTSSPEKLSVIENAAWALAALSTNSIDVCEELDRSGGVTILLSVVEKYPDKEELQENGLMVLCNMVARESTAHVVATNRVLNYLLHNTERFQNNVELQRKIIFAVSQLAMGDDELVNSMVELGVLKMVIQVMAAHQDDASIQENGCRTLGNMALHAAARRQVEEEGASRAVIRAMLTLDTFSRIQEFGAMALMNITAGLQNNKLRVKNNGGVLALMTCLKNYGNDSHIVQAALKAFANIIELDEVCRQLVDGKGIKTITNIASAFASDTEIQFYVGVILCGLSVIDDLSDEDVEMIDKTIIDLLSLPSADANICFLVCLTLEKLLNTERGMKIFLSEKRLDGILTIMKDYDTHPQILQCCSKIIAMLANANRSNVTTDAIGSILNVMKTHAEIQDLQIVGCGAVACACFDNASYGSYVVGVGGVGVISEAVSRFPDDERLHTVALMALGSISPIDTSIYAAQFHYVQDLILASMKKFSENFEIQISACNALSRSQPPGNRSSEFLESLAATLKRHGGRSEVQEALTAALKVFWQDEHQDQITSMMKNNSEFRALFEALDEESATKLL